MKRTILTDPNDCLKQMCLPVDAVDDEVRRLADDMLETMYAAHGVGLAAPQVGVLRRVIVMDVRPGGARQPWVCINPELRRVRGATKSKEGCLSVPGKEVCVDRAERVEVRYLDREGRPQIMKAQGLLAMCLQHEIDHLNGRLLTDPR